MSLVTPAASAMSSIEVASKPAAENARAAPATIERRRSPRGRSWVGLILASVYRRVYIARMTTAQLDYTPEELLADEPFEEPLRAGGVVCHGGFRADGTYVSPRTRFRRPAVEAWQENHRQTFGTEVLDAPLEAFPGVFPNLDQARLLLREGVREPIVAMLTRIGTVEGFGAMIRHLAPEDMQRFFDEDIRGTATAHLGKGLVEAQARDEAGWGEQAGHNKMWFTVRDIAFENPVTDDQMGVILQRMGLGGGYPTAPS